MTDRSTYHLDPESEKVRLMFALGAAVVALAGSARERQLSSELWELIPFVNALCRIGLSNQNQLVFAWKACLEEPMPFGMPPIGLPEEPKKDPEA